MTPAADSNEVVIAGPLPFDDADELAAGELCFLMCRGSGQQYAMIRVPNPECPLVAVHLNVPFVQH